MADVEDPKLPTIGGHKYSLGKLSAITQLHVWRRLVPIISAAGGVAAIVNIRSSVQPGETVSPDQVATYAAMLGPLLEAVSKLPDADVDYVINACMQVVRRADPEGRGWSAVASGGVMMFDDIGPLQILEIAGRVIIGSPGEGGIGDFFSGLPSK